MNKYCVKCGNKNEQTTRFCVTCGQKTSSALLPSKYLLLVFVILGVVAGSVFVGFVMNLPSYNQQAAALRVKQETFEENCRSNKFPAENCENMKNNLANVFADINEPRTRAVTWAAKAGCRLKNDSIITAYEAVLYDGAQKIEAEFDGAGNLIEYELESVAPENFPTEVLEAFKKDFPNAQVVEYEIDKMTDRTIQYEFEVDGATDKDITYEVKDGKAKRARNWCED